MRTTLRRRVGLGFIALSTTFALPGLLAAPARSQTPALLDPSTLTRFVDPLPLPLDAQKTGTQQGVPTYTMTARQFEQMLHRDMPGPTKVWGYDDNSGRPGAAGYPGPTIRGQTGQSIKVKWVNGLPDTPLLPVDENLPGATDHGPTAISTHLHGGEVPDESDGGPDAWFEPGDFRVLDYPNVQRGAPLWYHDHAVGITRLNVYAGLAGFYLLRDPMEGKLRLPEGEFDIPLAVQDRSFTQDGQLYYPSTWQCHSFGNTALVNGKIWPYLNVEPRKYRFRILNGSNTRLFTLSLFESDTNGTFAPGAAPGPAFNQIGSDGGMLSRTIRIPNKLNLAPGERADVIVDFSGLAGKSFILRNEARGGGMMDMGGGMMDGGQMGCGSMDGGQMGGPSLPDIMLFNVTKPLSSPDASRIPPSPGTVKPLQPRSVVRTRDLVLSAEMGMSSGSMNHRFLINDKGYHDPETERPHLGSTEIWRFINASPVMHPMHLHLVQFQVLDRQGFQRDSMGNPVRDAEGNLVPTGSPTAPPPEEAGWKDTVQARPGEVTRVIARFGRYSGTYVFHCHILDHEENDMMRPFTVVP